MQNDGFVKKISDYISKKVADKLSGMFKVERENYEKYWDDISPFIKFGCMKDDKFYDRIKDYLIFKNLEGKYLTLDEYIENTKPKSSDEESAGGKTSDVKAAEDEKTGAGEKASEAEKPSIDEKAANDDGVKQEAVADNEKAEDKKDEKGNKNQDKRQTEEKVIIYYVTDEKQQSQYINIFKEAGQDAVILPHNIDQPFITHLEYRNQKIKFQRIDAGFSDSFREEVEKKDEKVLKKNTEAMTKLFRKVLGKDKLEIKVERLKNDKIASVITMSEENRRIQDMMRMYSLGNKDNNLFTDGETLILNANHKLVQYIIDNEKSEYTPMICEQLYDLAYLSHRPLEPEAMTKFIQRSNDIMMLLTKSETKSE